MNNKNSSRSKDLIYESDYSTNKEQRLHNRFNIKFHKRYWLYGSKREKFL